MKRFKFEYLPLKDITVSETLNVRKANIRKGLEDLIRSIQEIGLQQPVVVYEKKDGSEKYELIIGQRRFLACNELGMEKIPALVVSVENETEALLRSFSENIQRLDLEPSDKMTVAATLRRELGSISKVAKRLGVTEQTVRNWLGFAGVPDPIRRMVEEGKFGTTTALRISRKIPDPKFAEQVAAKIRELPRSSDRNLLIDLAAEWPGEDLEQIRQLAKKRGMKVEIHLTPGVASALDQACKKYESTREDLTTQAVEDWLRQKGFLNDRV